MWQFFSSLPVWIWGVLLGIIGLAVVLICGGAAVSWVVTVIRGGKVHVGKDGVDVETPPDTE